MATNFGLTTSSPAVNVIQSINYLLATQGTTNGNTGSGNIIASNVVTANTASGVVSSINTGTISYLYPYIDVKYANSATGGTGFSSNCRYATYFGIYNSKTNTEDANPADYSWTQVVGGFGNTKQLYYTTTGGGQAGFLPSATQPSPYYTPVPDNTPLLINLLSNNAVATTNIQQGAVVSYNIAANTITAYNIATGTLTANLFAANIIFVNQSIQSTNATFDSPTSNGFWLDASNGSARFGGITSIGSNLTVGNNASIGGNLNVTGLITASGLVANTVDTNQLVISSATQVVYGANNTGLQQIQFTNGNTNNPTSPGFIWPSYTRGFAIQGGTTITPTTNGSVAGSSIQVNYNAFINTTGNSTTTSYNLVELWKSGSSSYYKDIFQTVRTYYDANPSYNSYTDFFTIPGNSGSLFTGALGNISLYTTNISSNLYDGITAYDTPNHSIGGVTQAFGVADAFVEGTGTTVQYSGTLTNQYSWITSPTFNILGASSQIAAEGQFPTILVGSGGTVAFMNSIISGLTTENVWTFESTGVFSNLNDIYCDLPVTLLGSTISGGSANYNYVVVGTSGTILYNTRTYNTAKGTVASTTGWSQASSNTTVNLNSVVSNGYADIELVGSFNTLVYHRATKWVAVGDNGTILSAPSGSGPWSLAANVPTTNNLSAVSCYHNPTNGVDQWMAVGANGTIITSYDGSNWTGPYTNNADGHISSIGTRNLYGVAAGIGSGEFVVAGEEIIMNCANASVHTGTSWSNVYLGGASVNSTLTRLQYQGSWANVANTSQPPAQQQLSNATVISGTYVDTNYVSGNPYTYYLVLGNMQGNATIYTNGPNLTITEIKR